MIVHCNFEELSALGAAAGRVLGGSGEGGTAVSAPADIVADLEVVAPLLVGDIDVRTLAEQERLQRVFEFMLADLLERMDAAVIEHHPAAEFAVAAYFEYAHVLSATQRVRRLGAEMRAVIELVTGAAPDEAVAHGFTFPA